MEAPILTTEQAQARSELCHLREAMAWARAHPFAVYCGEDDAAAGPPRASPPSRG